MKRKHDSEFAPDDDDLDVSRSARFNSCEPPTKRRKITPKNPTPMPVSVNTVFRNTDNVPKPLVKPQARPSKLRGKLHNSDDKETRLRKEQRVAAIEELNAIKDQNEFREYLDTYFGSSVISEKLVEAGVRASGLLRASVGGLEECGVTMTLDELSALKVYVGKRLQLKRLGIVYVPKS